MSQPFGMPNFYWLMAHTEFCFQPSRKENSDWALTHAVSPFVCVAVTSVESGGWSPEAAYFPDYHDFPEGQERSGHRGIEWEEEQGHAPRSDTSLMAVGSHIHIFIQVQEWMGNSLPPEEWGCRIQDTCLFPIHSDKEPAPQSLLELVRCSCKSGCGTMSCKYRRQGLDCSLACSECKGVCINMSEQTLEEDLD